MRLAVVLGRASPAGRLREVVGAGVARAEDALDVTVTWIDLAHLHVADASSLGGEEDGESVLRQLATADALLVGVQSDGGAIAEPLRLLLARATVELAGTPTAAMVAGASDPERRAVVESVLTALQVCGARVDGDPVSISTTRPGAADDGALDRLVESLDRAVHDPS